MAGKAWPFKVNVKSEAPVVQNGYVLRGNTLQAGLLDGTCVNEWNASTVAFWDTDQGLQHVDFTIENTVNIWRSGTTSWKDYFAPLKIKKFNVGSGLFEDITDTYSIPTTAITEAQWEKFVANLPPGRYKFYLDSGYRIDSEWYFENTDSPVYRADQVSVGDVLLTPPAGWQRIDGASGVLFTGTWLTNALGVAYYINGESKYTRTVGDTVRFKFKGTKLRIIGLAHPAYSDNVKIVIDGVEESYSNRGASTPYTVLYSKAGMPNVEHEVVITMQDTSYLDFDCIDIDATGKLLHPVLVERLNVADMQIGDIISCDYVATSGAVGTFTNLGEAKLPVLPATPTPTPNGSFYFIMVGRDQMGRKKLVADRPLQNSIAWSALNKAGLVNGVHLFKSIIDIEAEARLLSGGVTAADKFNEWDKIIMENTLGGKVPPGRADLWNYSSGYELTSTTSMNGADSRVVRGQGYGYQIATTPAANTTYRPMLLVRQLNVPAQLELICDSEAVFDTGVTIDGTITDRDAGDFISYRVLANGEVVREWSVAVPGPVAVNVPVPRAVLKSGTNTITVQATDGNTTVADSFEVIVKSVENTSVGNGVNDDRGLELKVGAGFTAYLKLSSPSPQRGYIVGGSLHLDVISGSGTIGIAPVVQDWTASGLNPASPPAVDVVNAIQVEITGAGDQSIDISALAKVLRNNNLHYGIAVYGNTELVLSALDMGIDYTYQPTELYQPEVVYGNRTTLKWKPLILERPESFLKLKLMRSTSPSMSGASVVFETEDKEVLQFEDTTIAKGDLYYSLSVEYVDNEPSGTKWDFDLADEAGFIQEDAVSGTVFEAGIVQLKRFPGVTEIEDFEDGADVTYDPAKVEIAGGKIQLKSK